MPESLPNIIYFKDEVYNDLDLSSDSGDFL